MQKMQINRDFPLSPDRGCSESTGVEIDLRKRKRFSRRRRISVVPLASARLLKKVDAAMAPDLSIAEVGIPL